ncbi:MAG TPA: glycosyl hydrolase [Thermoanaerobaculia bacterium]|nr:glycosyl hydrolase [Thermoanaerobaculia bacterium]
MKRTLLAVALLPLLLAAPVLAAEKPAKDQKAGAGKDSKKSEKKELWSSGTFGGLRLREIGPALTSGRIGDIAVDPEDKNTWYIAVASGGLWKTTNAGVTFKPIFDSQASYSIGCVTVDPNDPLTVWVGSGENNSQRSVGYGDGVYKSTDGGQSWTNVGLKNSEHIGKILVDPRNSDVVYVAAQGPLWNPGGDRGLYKTTDGGKTWKPVLTISENTGVSDIAFDPRDPDVLYATAYQRRRHVWTLINGGPESAIHKTRDGGVTWEKLTKGLPKVDMGRIGLAVSPVDPDVVYAIVESVGTAGGFFRSQDGGGNWSKMSGYVSGSPQYYQELFADPEDVDRVYSMDVFMKVTDDGGKTFRNAGERNKHVDNHALWIDPDDVDHLLVGSDGGLYESFDRGETWRFFPNLPVTQFYRVSADTTTPFYHVYGGTQDNFSLGAPARTLSRSGITNYDWYITQGGDGFETQVDPKDPNIVYAQAQHAGIVRFDKKNGETVDIRPQTGKGEPGLRFNWDSPLLISPHSHTRLYLAANRVFRSDDRGNSWRAISPDLTRQLDRNKLEVMGKVWSVDTVAKNASTSFYGNIVSLTESPRVENLIYIGTDDGLVQVSADAGQTWRKIERFPGVPDETYVSRLEASLHDADTVYAAFNNHKNGDFKPYLLKSTDRGATWRSIAGDLPERGSVWALVEDHVNPDLLFAGTEFGAYFTTDGGRKWLRLTGGLPTIAVRDLEIQRREDDLIVGTFGRGIWILDDYTPLRTANAQSVEKEATLLPVKKTWMYIENTPLGLAGKAFQGESFYVASNPPVGAVLTYYLKDEIKTRKATRQELERSREGEGQVLSYPSWEDLRAEDREKEPAILLTVKDEDGNVVRRLTGPVSAGFHRLTWDLRYPAATPVRLTPPAESLFSQPDVGPLVAPGRYTVTMAKEVDGVVTPLGEPQTFEATPLGMATLPVADRPALQAFQQKTARLQRAVEGAKRLLTDTQERIDHLQQAVLETPGADPKLAEQALALERRLEDLNVALTGDDTIGRRNEPTPASISERVDNIVSGWYTTAAPTGTHQEAYAVAAAEFAPVLAGLRQLVEQDLRQLETQLEAAGAPWTPGRVPNWQPE